MFSQDLQYIFRDVSLQHELTLAVCCENVTVWVSVGLLLVVVNMTVRSKPFRVTAIWGFPSRVCILHRSHSSAITDPLYLSVATKTYDGGRPSGKRVLKDQTKKSQALNLLIMIKKYLKDYLPCSFTQVKTRCHFICPGTVNSPLCLLGLFSQIQMKENIKAFLIPGIYRNSCWTNGLCKRQTQ